MIFKMMLLFQNEVRYFPILFPLAEMTYQLYILSPPHHKKPDYSKQNEHDISKAWLPISYLLIKLLILWPLRPSYTGPHSALGDV